VTTPPSTNSYIAIVDDDAAIRTALGRALRMENYDVELFDDGTSALKASNSERPTIVLDLQLPTSTDSRFAGGFAVPATPRRSDVDRA